MFGVTKETTTQSADNRELNTIIGRGSVIEGKLVISNSIRVDGIVKGDIASTGTLTVGGEGEIEGTITAENAIIGGRIRGTLNIQSKVILEKNAVLIGDLKTQKLNIAEGAIFDGNCIMEAKPAPPVKHTQERSGKEPGK
jgi:cytoskeletal protein CcmA (bactofilin family)